MAKESDELENYGLVVRQDFGHVNLQISISENDVIGFELFTYVYPTGFETAAQLLFTASSAAAPASEITISQSSKLWKRSL